jgi:hypothetical protein
MHHGRSFFLPSAVGDLMADDCDSLVILWEADLTPDNSGDRDTPSGDADIDVQLVRAEINGQRLPQPLAEEVFYIFSGRIAELVGQSHL